MDENNLTAWKYQGMILEREDDHQGAIRSFERALEIHEDDDEAFYYLAVSYYNNGCLKDAKIQSRNYKRRKDWDDAWCILAMSLQALGDEKGQLKHTKKH
jgi:Tetratricopeptide repeat.